MDSRFTLIAGPCLIESRDSALRHAEILSRLVQNLPIRFFYKSSFDKANRQSYESYRGLGLERGLAILHEIKEQFGVPICTDVHEVAQVGPTSEVADIIQIPAFLCRQTDLLVAAGLSKRIVQIKRGQFMSPDQMRGATEKIYATGNSQCWLTERGYVFGYGDLICDPRAIVTMKTFCSTVLHDATHSVQVPGGNGTTSGGRREFIVPLVRAALAVGCDGIFAETHEDPPRAKSDIETQIPLRHFQAFIDETLDFWQKIHS